MSNYNKDIKGYNLVEAARRRDPNFGGIAYNDHYNLDVFGITRETYEKIRAILVKKYGPDVPDIIKPSMLD
jgi:hypothetical protein